MFQTSQAAKKLGVSVPRFMAGIGQNAHALVLSAIMVVLGIVPLVALLTYLRHLNHSPIGWVSPLSAATHALVLCGVVAVLLFRVLYQARHAAFQNLERAIVVEDLAPIEIRLRFVTQLLGTSIADWMVGSIDGIKRADAKLRACAVSVRERLPDVESVDAQYALERKGRAKKLFDELQAAIAEHQSSFEQFKFQLREYGKVARSAEDEAMLKKMTTDLQAWLTEVKANSEFTADLIKTLAKF